MTLVARHQKIPCRREGIRRAGGLIRVISESRQKEMSEYDKNK